MERVQMAIAQNAKRLKGQYPEIKLLAAGTIGESKQHNLCVDIFIHKGKGDTIPKRLRYYTSKNKYGYVRTEVIKNKLKGKSHASVESGTILFNKNDSGNFGTVGCVVFTETGEDPCLITCNHVLNGNRYDNSYEEGEVVTTKQSGVKTDIATWLYGVMSPEIDVAICSILPAAYKLIAEQNLVYDGLDEDIDRLMRCEVVVYGKFWSEYYGYVVNPSVDFEIAYDNTEVELTDMILLSESRSKYSYDTLTEKGDSGAIVADRETNSIIGIVVGGDDDFTCVIPFRRIAVVMTEFSLTI